MMNVSGLTPIATIQKPDDTSLMLRLNQRLGAEVLQVSGDRVVLALEGVRVVAKLTSAEQAAVLAERRFAQFIVRDLSEPTITLQLVQPGHTLVPSTSTLPPDLIQNLLQYSGLISDEANTAIARALLNAGLLITPELVAELKNVLSEIEDWGQQDAQIAAMLKAAGLPLTNGTLSLARSNLPALVDLLKGLKTQLLSLQDSKLPPQISNLVKQALAALDKSVVNWGAEPAELAENLRQAVKILGNSLEREILESSENGSSTDELPGLMVLAKLQQELAKTGLHSAHEKIDEFLDGMRLMQFLNADPETVPLKGQWLRLDLPLLAQGLINSEQQESDADFRTAHLRVAYQPDNGTSVIDPTNTRFVIRVDLGANAIVQVDVSVVDRRVGAEIIASNEELRARAETELPSLKSGLDQLGYFLQSARCEVGILTSSPDSDVPILGVDHHRVSVEV